MDTNNGTGGIGDKGTISTLEKAKSAVLLEEQGIKMSLSMVGGILGRLKERGVLTESELCLTLT